ncbi:glycine zipper 2TM domain protein [Burkholderia pseudomallei MSHR2451]|uniref:glycine zipper 2TM domain-containing protein n=1 Tax=Burkholderia pseudomallei TaxID=28450 RepID=UPI000531E1CA|nr:glycine zipper 2TM domain-containing protein [Burkholderia pseudomallei]KGS83026.1 glycine zipper 2TM domain protein [Burkholderia pseudomallei MSHR7334]KGV56151.1 glycine zipper 2TM domain protein [Burkholderia pseudomallei BDU 2]KGV72642.1 glycine zipper 2TM domain protein [Burkholderia pseudomallei MSHR3964]KGV87647.1 glycine zipper 2TM domain protein [Burkholderia pseudomallei MSHR3951]KGV99169.1 glycine zipper 2TM domain protein [Burkholderia pseudomallei MSHR3960]
MLTRKTLTLAAMLTATVTLAGCFTPPGSADVYNVGQAQREQTVRMGTVESVRAVRIQGDGGGSALGTLGGGALGAVAGSAIGGGRGSVLTAIAGGIAGAVAGNAVGQGLSSANGVEITVRLDNGDLRSITQAATPEVFRAGERVRLLSSGGVTRVTH